MCLGRVRYVWGGLGVFGEEGWVRYTQGSVLKHYLSSHQVVSPLCTLLPLVPSSPSWVSSATIKHRAPI